MYRDNLQLNLQLGDIYYVDIPNYNNSMQYGIRPCIIVQSYNALKNTDMVWVIPLTRKIKALHLPHIIIHKDMTNGLKCDSMALVESSICVPKSCLLNKIGRVSSKYFKKIGSATIKQFPMIKYALELATA